MKLLTSFIFPYSVPQNTEDGSRMPRLKKGCGAMLYRISII